MKKVIILIQMFLLVTSISLAQTKKFEDLTYKEGKYYLKSKEFNGTVKDFFPRSPQQFIYKGEIVNGEIQALELWNSKTGVVFNGNNASFYELLNWTRDGHDGLGETEWVFSNTYLGNVYSGGAMFYFRYQRNKKLCGEVDEIRLINLFDEIVYKKIPGDSNWVEIEKEEIKANDGYQYLLSSFSQKSGRSLDRDNRMKLKIMSSEEVIQKIGEWKIEVKFDDLSSLDSYYQLAHFLAANKMYGEFLACIRDGLNAYPQANEFKMLLWYYLRKGGDVAGPREHRHGGG